MLSFYWASKLSRAAHVAFIFYRSGGPVCQYVSVLLSRCQFTGLVCRDKANRSHRNGDDVCCCFDVSLARATESRVVCYQASDNSDCLYAGFRGEWLLPWPIPTGTNRVSVGLPNLPSVLAQMGHG